MCAEDWFAKLPPLEPPEPLASEAKELLSNKKAEAAAQATKAPAGAAPEVPAEDQPVADTVTKTGSSDQHVAQPPHEATQTEEAAPAEAPQNAAHVHLQHEQASSAVQPSAPLSRQPTPVAEAEAASSIQPVAQTAVQEAEAQPVPKAQRPASGGAAVQQPETFLKKQLMLSKRHVLRYVKLLDQAVCLLCKAP